MKATRFPKGVVAAIRDGKILGIRAGTKPHRIIGIWAVVVENRVFVRSWSLKPRSWYRTFLEEPRGVIEVDRGFRGGRRYYDSAFTVYGFRAFVDSSSCDE